MEIAYPFHLDGSGRVAVQNDQSALIRQHLMTLIGTAYKERVMLVDYGSNATSLVFNDDVEEVGQELTNFIRDAVATYSPDVMLHQVTATSNPQSEPGAVYLEVQYTLPRTRRLPSENQIHTAVVKVGGRVVETS